MNHTPCPWRQFTSPENSWIGNAETGEIVADRPNISTPLINARRWNNNAEFIIKACNTHEELLVALKGCLSWLSSYPGGGAMAQYDKVRKLLATIEKGA